MLFPHFLCVFFAKLDPLVTGFRPVFDLRKYNMEQCIDIDIIIIKNELRIWIPSVLNLSNNNYKN